MTSAEYRALHAKPAQTRAHAPRTPAPRPDVPPAAEVPAEATPGPKNAPPPGRDTAPIAPAVVPLRWQLAGAAFQEQHPGAFRLVVVGSVGAELEAVLGALESLK